MAKLDICQELFRDSAVPIEIASLNAGARIVCGVDEAGRGPLAGPVVAAAVIFQDCETLWNCRDSKQLTAKRRDLLFEQIEACLELGVGICAAGEVDKLNIRRASLEAMRRAVVNLSIAPDLLLVDGRDSVPLKTKSIPIIRGDSRVSTIAAASIIAKVTRDRIMKQFDQEFPEYGFRRHFGYPTAEHRAAIRSFGPCPIHRKSYRGVREYF